jgi:hypothetical protein
MANEKDSRRPSVLLGHDDILEMLVKNCSRNGGVDMWTAIYLVSSSSNAGDCFDQKGPLKFVDKKSKSEKILLGRFSTPSHLLNDDSVALVIIQEHTN